VFGLSGIPNSNSTGNISGSDVETTWSITSYGWCVLMVAVDVSNSGVLLERIGIRIRIEVVVKE
jgi:hypothetical protein